MERGEHINMLSHTPLITLMLMLVNMCDSVCLCEHMSQVFTPDTDDIGFWKRPDASVSIQSSPSLMDNYQRVMAFCHKHNRVKIKRPCKDFVVTTTRWDLFVLFMMQTQKYDVISPHMSFLLCKELALCHITAQGHFLLLLLFEVV